VDQSLLYATVQRALCYFGEFGLPQVAGFETTESLLSDGSPWLGQSLLWTEPRNFVVPSPAKMNTAAIGVAPTEWLAVGSAVGDVGVPQIEHESRSDLCCSLVRCAPWLISPVSLLRGSSRHGGLARGLFVPFGMLLLKTWF